jgi:hypothetical protein
MLQRLSDQVRECQERAADAKRNADATADPARKAELLDLERSWLLLARSFEVGERLRDFAGEHAMPGHTLDEFLARTARLNDAS